MKLLSKTSLLIITASIFIFWIGNIVFFYITKEMISDHINRELMTEMAGVMDQLKKNDSDPGMLKITDEVSVKEVGQSISMRPVFSDTVLFSTVQQKYIAHRALRFTIMSSSGNREITIYKSLLSADKLIEKITVSSIILLIVFIIMIYALNRFIFANVWSSFSNSLEKVDEYDFKNLETLSLPVSEIDEFDKLNKVLLEMAERIQSDYRSLKELTANTSHEIQTPLAIIKSKAEILLQSDNLSEADMEIANSIIITTGRLSKLNQSLLLIAKIENNQFEETGSIELKDAIERNIESLDMLFEAGNIKVVTNIEKCGVVINQVLLDVLLSNLLKNAINHGTRESEIKVELKDCMLSISNLGSPLPFPDDQLFKRFIKGSGKQGSTGIGLEIVRKVCNYYRIKVGHDYTDGLHTFFVNFSEVNR